MRQFEIHAEGHTGELGCDAELWVQAEGPQAVIDAIQGTGALFCGEVPMYDPEAGSPYPDHPNNGTDFFLPKDLKALRKRLAR